MQDDDERPGSGQGGAGRSDSREQQAGEGGTTRFGMEEGDNTDTPATGGPAAEEETGDESGSGG